MKGGWVRPNTRRVNLFISKTLGSEFFTQWNLNTSLSDSRILFCRKAFCIFPRNRMDQKRYENISQWILQRWTGFQTFIQRYRIFIWLGLVIIDNSYFSCFCRFSNHRSMGQTKFFPLLKCFSFTYLFQARRNRGTGVIFAKLCFSLLKKIMLKSKIVHNYKTSWNFSKFIDIYNIIIDLGTRDGILIVINSERFSHF